MSILCSMLSRRAARKIWSAVQPAAQLLVESLENRQMLSVSTTAAGWTSVTPSSDSKLIYVSTSSGSDANNGLSANAPVASITKAYSLLRNGMPDWILFKRGDTFVGNFSNFTDSGRSAQEPMVITSYGSTALPRPVIDATTMTAFRMGKSNHDIDVLGLQFTSSTHNPNSPNYNGLGSYGFYDLGGTNDLLIEDCSFSYFANDLTFQGYYGPLSNITLRRSEVLDAFNPGGISQGLYADTVTNLTIQDNTFDHDGWNTQVSGAGANQFSHDCYLHESNNNVVVTGNTFADASSFGLEARSGGIVDNNTFINDPFGLAFGLVNGSTTRSGGVAGEAIGNVFLGTRAALGSGTAMMIGNLRPGGNTVVANNIFANDPGGDSPAILLTPGVGVSNANSAVGVNSLTIENNTIYGWGFGIGISSSFVPGSVGPNAISNVSIRNNNFQYNAGGRIISDGVGAANAYVNWSGNTYASNTAASGWFTIGGTYSTFATWKSKVEPTAIMQAVPFANAGSNVASFMASLGLSASDASYISGARSLSASNWDGRFVASALINFVQAGFGISGSGIIRPTLPVSGPASITIGSTYALTLGKANDPGQTSVQYVVHWGDGSSNTVASAATLSHKYGATGTYAITVDIVDGNGTHPNSAFMGVSVNPAGGSGGTTSTHGTVNLTGLGYANPGVPYTLDLASVTDPGHKVSQYIVTWGDGASNTYTKLGNVTHTYSNTLHAGIAVTISVEIEDNSGPGGANAFIINAGALPITINPPYFAPTGASTASVGSLYALSLSPVSKAGVYVTKYTIHWGDGSTNTYGAGSTVTHLFPAKGTDKIVVDYADSTGTHTNVATIPVSVGGGASMSLSGATYTNSGASYSLTLGTAVDPGYKVADYIVHWGDGSSTTYTSAGVKTHIYTNTRTTAISETISVDLVDNSGAKSAAATHAGIATLPVNIHPKRYMTLTGSANTNPGATYKLNLGAAVDPGHTVSQYTVHWGDGSTTTYKAAGNVTHVYANTKTTAVGETISVDIIDNSGSGGAKVTTANLATLPIVVNARPTLSVSGSSTATTGSAYSLNLFNVSDPGFAVSKYTVHWGDGSTSTYTATGVVSHVYTAAASDKITVDLTDSTGVYTSAGTFNVLVSAPSSTGGGSTTSALLTGAATAAVNGIYKLTLGTVAGKTISQYNVNWGDGSMSTYASAGLISHLYTSAGTDNIVVTLVESGAMVAGGTLSVKVS